MAVFSHGSYECWCVGRRHLSIHPLPPCTFLPIHDILPPSVASSRTFLPNGASHLHVECNQVYVARDHRLWMSRPSARSLSTFGPPLPTTGGVSSLLLLLIQTVNHPPNEQISLSLMSILDKLLLLPINGRRLEMTAGLLHFFQL